MMTKEEFLSEMQDVLQTERTLCIETALEDLDEWDSLSMMATMAFLDKNFGIRVGIREVKAMSVIGDIAAKAGIQ